jgi:hypothetical protein
VHQHRVNRLQPSARRVCELRIAADNETHTCGNHQCAGHLRADKREQTSSNRLPEAGGQRRSAAERAHGQRHDDATILMTLGVPDPIVRKVTGHRSRELERYQHLTPELRALTVNLIATELFRGKRARKERESGTPTGTVRGRRVTENLEGRQRAGTKRDVGGVDGTRTRGLRRGRPEVTAVIVRQANASLRNRRCAPAAQI